jgi:hypothetical protein
MMFIHQIARIAHQANKAYCESLGDFSQPDWETAPSWQQNSALYGVVFLMEYPDAPPSASHDSWFAQKEAEGWRYGPVKDVEKKEHPCMLPYRELPADQRIKDVLFQAVVRALLSEVK